MIDFVETRFFDTIDARRAQCDGYAVRRKVDIDVDKDGRVRNEWSELVGSYINNPDAITAKCYYIPKGLNRMDSDGAVRRVACIDHNGALSVLSEVVIHAPVHRTVHAGLPKHLADFSTTESNGFRTVTLPSSPSLTAKDVAFMTDLFQADYVVSRFKCYTVYVTLSSKVTGVVGHIEDDAHGTVYVWDKYMNEEPCTEEVSELAGYATPDKPAEYETVFQDVFEALFNKGKINARGKVKAIALKAIDDIFDALEK